MALVLSFLGSFQAHHAGQPVKFATDYARALLAYLAVEQRPYARTTLAALLWPNQPETSARQNLRQTLFYLRQALGDTERSQPVLRITPKTLQCRSDTVASDVQRFQQLLATCTAHDHTNLPSCAACIARLQTVVDLYQGEFLQGFFVKGSPPFEEWALLLREQLHRQALDACANLAEHYQAQGDTHRLQQYAVRQLAWEPWREIAHRQLMWALATRGQRGAALAQYAACCRVLAEELGAQPEAETIALYEQIRRGTFAKVTSDKDLTVHPINPASRQPAPPLYNLLEPPTPLIGRAEAVAALVEQIQRPEVRLLTLVGPGGMGKTRLAVAVGRACLGTFADGVCFVSLAAISTPAALASTIATTLGLTLQGSDPRQLLLQGLRAKRLLLILDNFEHLLAAETKPPDVSPQGAVELVIDMLKSAPEIQILVTSRERLKLRSEKLYLVPPLTFAPEATLPEAADASAVRLFVQTVQQQMPGFQLTAENLPAVLRICRLVQGMPLGLEMAAAWTPPLSVAEIADEIAQSTDFLTVDWPDVPARQRSMRAVFQWSWHLLSAAEQQLLCRLAHFAGSFTRAAAEQIAGATLATLTSLLNKSLVHYVPTGAEAALTPRQDGKRQEGKGPAPQRYELHALIRQFAAEQLTDAQERAAAEMRYSAFYLDFLATREAPLLGRHVRETVNEIHRELDHIRQAWRWAVDHAQWTQIAQGAYTLSEFFAIVGYLAEGEQLFKLAAAHTAPPSSNTEGTGVTTPERLRLLSQLVAFVALAHYRQGKADAIDLAQQATRLGRTNGSLEAQILGYYAWAVTATLSGQLAEAKTCFEQMRCLFVQARVQGLENSRLKDYGWRYYLGLFAFAMQQGEFAAAQAYGAEGLRVAQSLGSLRGEMSLRLNLISIYQEQGAFAKVRQEAEAVLLAVCAMGWRWGEATAHQTLAITFTYLGDYALALAAYRHAQKIAQEIGEIDLGIELTFQLAHLYLLLGDRQRSQALLPSWLPQTAQNATTKTRFAALSLSMLQHWVEGDLPQARHMAIQAWTFACAVNNRFDQACAQLYLGHVQAELQELAAAATAYQAALAFFNTLPHPLLGAEPRAGLAQLALRQGNLTAAQAWVAAILPALATQPHVGVTTPFFTYLTCYQVLVANADPRAASVLQQGYTLLQQEAAPLDDETRRCFLAEVPSHRALAVAYLERQGRADRDSASP